MDLASDSFKGVDLLLNPSAIRNKSPPGSLVNGRNRSDDVMSDVVSRTSSTARAPLEIVVGHAPQRVGRSPSSECGSVGARSTRGGGRVRTAFENNNDDDDGSDDDDVVDSDSDSGRADDVADSLSSVGEASYAHADNNKQRKTRPFEDPSRRRAPAHRPPPPASIASMSSSLGDDTSDDEASSCVIAEPRRRTMEEINAEKRQYLYNLERMEHRGVKMHRRFTMDDSLEDIRNEYTRLKTNKETDASIRFQRRMLMACITGIEFLNNKFDPLDIKLDGWSDSINENIDDYDEIFEELYLKYQGKAKMAPELRLLFMLGGSGVMFHLTNSMFRSARVPDLADVMKQNPDLMRQFTQATFSMQQQQQAPAPSKGGGGGGMGGLFGIVGSLFGGGGSSSPPPRPGPTMRPASVAYPQQGGASTTATATILRGPKNVDSILKELRENAFDSSSPPSVYQQPSSSTTNNVHPGSVVEILSRSASVRSSIGGEDVNEIKLHEINEISAKPVAKKPARKPRAVKGSPNNSGKKRSIDI
jgi:hypothetical protein